ncbi:hypothetical protein LBMAG56_16930 [Verrucomicrobiota bacterium]|nr:hypothetical protein LBMAG56_16930 [Verrucomicrobiota bacterium]
MEGLGGPDGWSVGDETNEWEEPKQFQVVWHRLEGAGLLGVVTSGKETAAPGGTQAVRRGKESR